MIQNGQQNQISGHFGKPSQEKIKVFIPAQSWCIIGETDINAQIYEPRKSKLLQLICFKNKPVIAILKLVPYECNYERISSQNWPTEQIQCAVTLLRIFIRSFILCTLVFLLQIQVNIKFTNATI